LGKNWLFLVSLLWLFIYSFFMRFSSNRIPFALLFLILLFAAYLRLFAVADAPFWIDESISSIVSKNILEKGLPIFDSGTFYGRAIVFHYSQAFSMLVFGINDFGARFPSVLFGLFTMILAFLFAREFFKKDPQRDYLALLPAIIFSIFFLEIFFSRQARFYQLFQLAFFSTIYFVYKSKEKNNYSYFAVLSFLIAIDTQIAGIILAPIAFANLFLTKYKLDKEKLTKKTNILSGIIVVLVSLYYLGSVFNVSTGSAELVTNYASNYLDFFPNMNFVLVLGAFGLIWAFLKEKEKTLFLVVPSIVLLALVVFVELFAFRYVYPVTFAIVFFFSLFLCFLIQKFGKMFIFVALLILLVPSNLFFPLNYVTVINPISGAFNDYSAPIIDLKNIQLELKQEMLNSKIVSLFPASLEWYIKKPDFVIPYSMDGRTKKTSEKEVYSGAPYISTPPQRPYYFVKDYFSASKIININEALAFESGCDKKYSDTSLEIYYCN